MMASDAENSKKVSKYDLMLKQSQRSKLEEKHAQLMRRSVSDSKLTEDCDENDLSINRFLMEDIGGVEN